MAWGLGAAWVFGFGFPDVSGFIHHPSTASAAMSGDAPLHDPPAADDWSRGAFVRGARALEPEFPDEARRAAARWLADRLALPELADDPEAAWAAWGAWVLLPDASFYRRLAENHAARSDAAAREREQLLRRLTDRREALVGVYRRLYARLPAEEKSGLLIEMLGSEVPALQTAACQLAMRTLQNAGELDPAVTHAAVGVLEARDAGLRGAAAQLIEQLDPTLLAALAPDRLESETDATAAAALLRALAARPRDGRAGQEAQQQEAREQEARRIAAAAARWLDLVPAEPVSPVAGIEPPGVPTVGEARIAAFDAAVSVFRRKVRTGRAGDPGVIPPRDPVMVLAADRVAAALPVRVTPESVALLASLQRFETVVQLLQSRSLAVARAAADGLAGQPRFVDPIVHAAMQRVELFDAALDALAAHRPTAVAFERALAIPAADAGNRRARLVAMAARLPGEQLLLAMRAADDEGLIDACIAPLLLARSPGNGEGGTNGSGAGRGGGHGGGLPREAWSPELELALAARLARARLSLDESLGALDVLALMRERHAEAFAEESVGGADAVRSSTDGLIAAGIEAGVRLNRLDHASGLLGERPALVDAWLTGLAKIESPEDRRSAADRLLRLEREHERITLSDVQRERATRLRDGGDSTPAPEDRPEPS